MVGCLISSTSVVFEPRVLGRQEFLGELDDAVVGHAAAPLAEALPGLVMVRTDVAADIVPGRRARQPAQLPIKHLRALALDRTGKGAKSKNNKRDRSGDRHDGARPNSRKL